MTSSSTRGGGGAGSGWSLLGVYSTDPCALGSALGRPDFFLSVARRDRARTVFRRLIVAINSSHRSLIMQSFELMQYK